MIKLLHGDCLELLKNIPDNSIDMILTDPPFEITYNSWDKIIPFQDMWLALNRIIKPNNAIILFGVEPFSSALRLSNIKNYKYDWIWNKKAPANQMMVKKQPLRIVENIMVFNSTRYFPQEIIPFNNTQCLFDDIKPIRKKGKQGTKITDNINTSDSDKRNKEYDQTNKNYPKNILTFSKDHPSYHSTQKPVALGQYLIRTYSKEGETILDFTAGSFTTAIACINTNRKFIGIELDEYYFQIGQNRINKHLLKLNMFKL